MEKKKVKVLIEGTEGIKEGERTLLLNKREEEELELELAGQLPYVKEFEDIKGEIITSDLVIRRISKRKRLKEVI